MSRSQKSIFGAYALAFLLSAGAPALMAAEDFGKPASSDELKRYCPTKPPRPAPPPPLNYDVTCDPRWYQGESALAADVHRGRLVGAQNDLYFGNGGCKREAKLGAFGDCGVSAAVNFNPGIAPKDWSRFKLTRSWCDPKDKDCKQYVFLIGFDPSTAVDSQYRYYAAYGVADFNLGGTDEDDRKVHNVPNAVVVASSANGDKWLKTNAVAYDPGPAGKAKYFHDKFWIAIDTKFFVDRIYVTWTRNDLVANKQDIVLSYSTDLGKTWIGPKVLNTKFTTNKVIGAFPAVADDGTLYVVWDDYGSGSLYVTKSVDGGITWNDPVFVTVTSSDAPGSLGVELGCNSGRTMFASPQMAVDRTGNVFIVFASRTIPAGADNFHIYATASTDKGKTWNAPVRVSNPDNHQYNPAISIDALNKINVAYLDRRDDPNNCFTRSYLSRSIMPSDVTAFVDFKISYYTSIFEAGKIVNMNSNGPGDYSGAASIGVVTYPYYPDMNGYDFTGGSVAGEIYTAAKP